MKAHPCIGGPLDGEFAMYHDFWQTNNGIYAHMRDEYVQFNNAHHESSSKKSRAAVAFIHVSKLPKSISPRDR